MRRDRAEVENEPRHRHEDRDWAEAEEREGWGGGVMPRIEGWIDSDQTTFSIEEETDNVLFFSVSGEAVWSCTPDDARDIAAALTKWAKGK
jgi:hypothetical protein